MTPRKGGVLAAYMVVSLIWGSTYLAIRIGVSHLPPALFGAIRFLTAGSILLVLSLALGQRLPKRPRDWVTAAVVGIMLLGLGNGLVIWAEQSVESGTTAILVVTGALMMAAFDALIPGSEARPTWRQFAALFVGFGGVVLLVGGNPAALGEAGWLGPAAVVVAAASWSLGSIFSKRRPVNASPYVFSALQMLFGGGALAVTGLVSGEAAELTFTPSGFGAVLYLIVFGSIVAYTSYVYLLRHAAPAFVGTSVYVNTVVAVLLGWLVLSEHVSLRTFVAMAVILGSVVWVRRAEPARAHRAQEIEAGAVVSEP
ncbi:MAG: EamA family transporter [Gemmatimonadales bacterium]